MSRIIFVNRFYRPDHSATAQLLTDLAECVAAEKVTVVVLTSGLSYSTGQRIRPRRETIAGVSVYRVWTTAFGRRSLLGRALDYASFYASTFFAACWFAKKDDLFVVKTDPPLICVVIAAVCAIRGSRMINWIQDLFPEVAEALGMALLRHPRVSRALRGLRTWSLHKARRNVVIGESMARRLVDLGVDEDAITLVPNWVVGETPLQAIEPSKNRLRTEWALQDRFVVGYSGNLGRAHDDKAIFAFMLEFQHQDRIHFLFIGGGSGMEALRRRTERSMLHNASFKPYQRLDNLSESLSVPDVHLVTLLPQMEGLIVPSKLYGILAVRRPVVFIGDRQGEVARLIEEHGCGRAFAPDEKAEFARHIRRLSLDVALMGSMQRAAGKLYNERYVPEVSRSKLTSLLLEASGNRLCEVTSSS